MKNVFSVFDGMSCLQQALSRSGIHYDNYYASEIDKHAIKVTQANYPNTIQMGSITDINPDELPIIDLFAGGSPCQSFSFAGKRKGMSTKDEIEILTLEHYLQLKSEGYEFEGQSYLFWEYMRLLTAFRKKNPNIKFLLENVMMGEKWEKILNRAIGVNPIEINSALVSAQNRRRLYWTNIGMVPGGLFGDPISVIKQPKDRGILLKDILEDQVDEKYFLSAKLISGFINHTKAMKEKGNGFAFNPTDGSDKGKCLTARYYKMGVDDNYIVASRGRNPENPKSREPGLNTEQQLEPRLDGKTNCLISVQKDNLIMQLNPSKESGGKQPYQQNRIYDSEGIAPALCANKSDLLITNFDLLNERQLANHKNADEKANTFLSTSFKGSQANGMTLVGTSRIRRLTPTECERLQTVTDGYTNHVSDTQRYRMLGNGWTVEIIVHILSYL